jgi:hypothetical protein
MVSACPQPALADGPTWRGRRCDGRGKAPTRITLDDEDCGENGGGGDLQTPKPRLVRLAGPVTPAHASQSAKTAAGALRDRTAYDVVDPGWLRQKASARQPALDCRGARAFIVARNDGVGVLLLAGWTPLA